MSIIEQTLDKLDRTSPQIPDSFGHEVKPFNFPQSTKNEYPWAVIILSFCLLILMIFITIALDFKLNISIDQKFEEEALSTQEQSRSDNVGKIKLLTLNTPVVSVSKTAPLVSTSNEVKEFESHVIISPPVPTIKKPIDPAPQSMAFISKLSKQLPQQIFQGNYQDVIDTLKKYKSELGNSWEYHYWKSQAYTGMGQLNEAKKVINHGLKNNSQAVLLWIQKGVILQEEGDHRTAVEIFKQAELMPSKPESLYLNLGYSAATLGDFPLTKRAYTKYLALTKNSPNHDLAIRNEVIEYVKQMNKM